MQDRFRVRGWSVFDSGYYDGIQNMLFGEENNMTLLDAISKGLVNEIIPEQCTGLKDKNGKLIYEGDIVEVTSPENWNIFDEYSNSEILGKGVVVTKPGCAFIKKNDIDGEEKKYYFALYSVVEDASVEVIGNIHENSELLEDNK